MNSVGLVLLGTVISWAAPAGTEKDQRVVRANGYHIVSRPARVGETPPEIKQEKAEEDGRRKRNTPDITDQTPPTRQPELKPKEIKP